MRKVHNGNLVYTVQTGVHRMSQKKWGRNGWGEHQKRSWTGNLERGTLPGVPRALWWALQRSPCGQATVCPPGQHDTGSRSRREVPPQAAVLDPSAQQNKWLPTGKGWASGQGLATGLIHETQNT